MRVNDAEQRLCDFGELVIDLEVDAGGQECEGFDQAFDVRVFALIGFEDKARSNLGILAGELHAHLAQEGEFAFVIKEEIVTHCDRP